MCIAYDHYQRSKHAYTMPENYVDKNVPLTKTAVNHVMSISLEHLYLIFTCISIAEQAVQ